MSAPLRVVLSTESDRTLLELRVATNLPQQIKDRAHMVRLKVVLQKLLEDKRSSSLPRSLCRNSKNLSARILLEP